MPRILLLAGLFLTLIGCLLDGSDADPAPAVHGTGCERIEDAPDATPPPEGQRLVWAEGARLWALIEGCDSPQLLREHQREIGQVRWSPDGNSIALQDGTGTTVVRLDAASPLRSFGSEEFTWLDNEHLLIARSRLPVEPRTATLVVVDVTSGEEEVFDGAHSFAAHDGSVAFWQDAGPCPQSVLPPDQIKPGAALIERRCPRLVIRTPDDEQPALTVDVDEMLAAMPLGAPSLGLTSPGSLDWSPDGAWIVFKMCGVAASGCVDTQHMFEAHVGSGVVTYVGDTSGPIAWSPDSSRYVYGQEGGRPYDAYPRPLVLRPAGVTPADDTVLSPPDVEDVQPSWAPNSATLAFTSWLSLRIPPCFACPPEEPGQGIWTARPVGSDRRQLTSSPVWVDTSPQWSPDSAWILFERRGPHYVENHGYAKTQLWIMRPDGADQHMIADISNRTGDNFPLDQVYDWWTAPKGLLSPADP